MNKLTKIIVKREIKRYSNSYLKSIYLQLNSANGLNKAQREYKSVIISAMKERGLIWAVM